MPFPSKIFDVNWKRLVRWLAPLIRKSKGSALLNSLVTPINDMHGRFVRFRNDVQYRLLITPQICFLEKALNDKYDRQQRRIRIEDAREFAPVVFFQKEELKPVKFYKKGEGDPVVFFQKDEVGAFTTDFLILIPVAVPFDMNELTAYVNVYKLAGKTFRVQIV